MLVRAVIIGVGLSLATVAVRADTLVMNDGSKLVGKVTETDSSYTVKTKVGEVVIPKSDVAEWRKDAPGAEAVPPPVAAPTGKPAGAASAPTEQAKQKMARELLNQGKNALLAGDFKTARDALLDASQLAPRDPDTLKALGLAYLALNNMPDARATLDRAVEAIKPLSPDRVLAINDGAAQLAAGGSPARAAKILMDYLNFNNDLDEPALNSLGVALRQYPKEARRSTLFINAVKFYDAYNTKMEATRPGYRRWGSEWHPSQYVDQKVRDAGQVDIELRNEANNVQQAQRQLASAQSLLAIQNRNPFAQQKVAQAQADLQSAQQRYNDRLAAATAPPPYPSVIEAVALGDIKPPPVTDPQETELAARNPRGANPQNPVIASADPMGAGSVFPGNRGPSSPAPADTNKPTGADPMAGGANPPAVKPTDVEPTLKPADKPAKPDVSAAITVAPPAKKASAAPVAVTRYAAAFPISKTLLITSAEAVNGASEASLEGANGISKTAKVLRCDTKTGLALLEVAEGGLAPLPIGDQFAGGDATCAGFPTVDLFNPMATAMKATTKAPSDQWMIDFHGQNPRLAGGPLIADGQVVGVELGGRDMDPGQIPAVTLEKLRAFIGADMPTTSPMRIGNPCGVMFRVEATHESQ